MTAEYPELAELPAALRRHSAILDGELVAFEGGRPAFHRAMRSANVTYVFFDLLALDGKSLLDLSYVDRRARLERLKIDGPRWKLSERFDDGDALFEQTGKLGLEGITCKRKDSHYEPGRRSGAWLKIKHQKEEALVVGGWIPDAAGGVETFLVGRDRASGEIE
jgi:bifunctional non-homologous end joining protein LigD